MSDNNSNDDLSLKICVHINKALQRGNDLISSGRVGDAASMFRYAEDTVTTLLRAHENDIKKLKQG